MDGSSGNTLQDFKNLVGVKYEMYNSLFTSLPFNKVERTGVLLSLFVLHCEEGFRRQESPNDIIYNYVKQFTAYRTEQEQIDLLFRFIQYSERQVVLFDALEDAAFPDIHDLNGGGTMKHVTTKVNHNQAQAKLAERLKDFSIRLVLTAHPTQFYPSGVLGIIHDLAKALANNNTGLVNTYLEQLGKTPFFKKEKPTPYDEAVNLIWFLENVFYQAGANILANLKRNFPEAVSSGNPLIRMGFWPGGDRDGNPFVNSGITLRVAEALRSAVLKSYYIDVRRLKRRLTFQGIDTILNNMEKKLFDSLFTACNPTDVSSKEMMSQLLEIKHILVEQHNGLFLNLIETFICKIELFGMYFASLDVRQDSSIHEGLIEAISEKLNVLPSNYKQLNAQEKINALLHVSGTIDEKVLENDIYRDTIETMRSIRRIQELNGEEGCHRYIISHSTSALNIIEVFGLFLMSGWQKESLTIDIVPLFETIEDLRNAGKVMRELYEHPVYKQHLIKRNNTQTIMLGFSDGTKDGGYLMANWSIYKTKEELSLISREYGVEVIFFDGRGGPPARGGGKTHQFYASMGNNISNKEIQLTIQGQTISSNFGTIASGQFNMEQLMNAGILNAIFHSKESTLDAQEDALVSQLAFASYDAYNELKNHPDFLEYLNYISPLRYYAETNIGSRPSKRKTGNLNLNDLRAVPYVGSWSQIKQNLPGYYGVGTALQKLDEQGRWNEIQKLYEGSLFFRTLLDNSEMAMTKCFFPLTEFLKSHPKYGPVWMLIHDEYERTKKYLLKLNGEKELMGDKPVDKLSIQMRQRIELPLITIQQYALTKIREMEEKGDSDNPAKKVFEKLVIRCSFGIINAERNSA